MTPWLTSIPVLNAKVSAPLRKALQTQEFKRPARRPLEVAQSVGQRTQLTLSPRGTFGSEVCSSHNPRRVRYSRMSSTSKDWHLEHFRQVKGHVAFLELENDPEEEQIHAKLEEVADPLFPNVARCENEGRCYLVLLIVNSATKEEVVFNALWDAARGFSEASPSTRRFYSAEEFWDMDKEAFG
jgi:hypothetical protein